LFTYIGCFIGVVPLCIIPVYGAIFWSSYNLWNVFEKNYSKKPWFSRVNAFAFVSFVLFLIADYLWLDFQANAFFIVLRIALAFLLFKTMKEVRLAYFVAVFTVFDEMAGEFIGVWTHEIFSIFSLMCGYVFLLWVCLTITELIKGTKKWNAREIICAIGFLLVFAIDPV